MADVATDRDQRPRAAARSTRRTSGGWQRRECMMLLSERMPSGRTSHSSLRRGHHRDRGCSRGKAAGQYHPRQSHADDAGRYGRVRDHLACSHGLREQRGYELALRCRDRGCQRLQALQHGHSRTSQPGLRAGQRRSPARATPIVRPAKSLACAAQTAWLSLR
jgi:hypothetical protein